MNNRRTWNRGFTPVVAVLTCFGALTWFGASAKADITWVFNPSQSPIVFSGSLGDVVFNGADGALGSEVDYPNGQPQWIQKYDGIPQALSQFNPSTQGWTDANGDFHPGLDPAWGPYPGYTNSAQTSSFGNFTTVGNNFLQSLNFGPEPEIGDYSNFHPSTQFSFSGNYYPDAAGSPAPGFYGNATSAQTGLTFIGAAGSNIFATGTAGQQSRYGTVLSTTPGGGPLDTGHGPNGTGTAGTAALTGTAGYANSNGNTVTPTAAGTFDATKIRFTGVLAFSASFQADNGVNSTASFAPQQFFDLVNAFSGGTNGLATISNDISGATGTLTRGAGGTYVMQVPYSATMSFGTANSTPAASGLPGTPDPSRPDPLDPNHLYGSTISTAVFIDLHFTANFTAVANIAPGDANFDGIVNGQDLASVSSNWLATNAAKLGSGDVNGDGIVNGQDLALISSNWLHTTPPLSGNGSSTAVPEPGTWILLGFGGILLAIRRRLV